MVLEYDYVAGLFDGEGWCAIRRAPASLYGGKREWAYQCSVEMTMRERSILEGLQELFGGTLREVKSRSDKHSQYWHWRAGGREAMYFAIAIADKSIAKKAQLWLLAEFQKEKTLQGNQPLGNTRYELYEKCFDKMKELNMKGQGKL